MLVRESSDQTQMKTIYVLSTADLEAIYCNFDSFHINGVSAMHMTMPCAYDALLPAMHRTPSCTYVALSKLSPDTCQGWPNAKR
ncbi:hypothetical protein V6N12_009554 [Hibiscus sabdariffa]|uniref:Uncharacterized protein n=1 Tax=Hibiscus sabdariffa TaxID=183260 RepID=A0ABR2AUD6_9ROSI